MPRRPHPLAALAAATVLVLTGCGEQVPGGAVVEAGQPTESRTGQPDGARALAEPQAETADDAADPLVIRVGEQEYLTTMAIYRAYDAAKGGPNALGSPAGAVEVLGDGRRQEFDGGRVYWSPRTGARIVRGRILETYLDNGGAEGRLGWPVIDESTDDDAVYSDFENGRILIEDRAVQVIDRRY
ncbi:MAG TPA: hypothetical protein GX694_02460 [Actinomycetales bacterium]|nr:hypothetical protein [Actinomycetales bacterium]